MSDAMVKKKRIINSVSPIKLNMSKGIAARDLFKLTSASKRYKSMRISTGNELRPRVVKIDREGLVAI